MTSAVEWYERLRQQYLPARVRVLLIGESAPDPGATQRRFFYAPTLDRRDNLFRGVIAAFYDAKPGVAGTPKKPWLDKLVADGVFLIDLVPHPVDKLTSKERAKARRAHAAACVSTARAIAPDGIVVCHQPSFKVLEKPLRAARLPLLHDAAIPFPLGNHRAQFVIGMKAALSRLAA